MKTIITLSALTIAAAPPTIQSPSYSIADIQVHLYYQQSGAFDTANVTTDGASILWNTDIGAGAAESPSGAILILVKVRGNWLASSHGHRPHLKLVVQADSTRKVLHQETIGLDDFFSEQSFIWVPLIVLGTGCDHERISAALLSPNGATQSPLAKTVRFECGE